MSHDIFVSYSRKDVAAVKAVKEELEKLGFSCWMDLTGIVSGTRRFSRTLVKAIDDSGTLLFFLSADSQTSEWALNEIDYATDEKKKVVLVRFNDDPMTKEFRFLFGRTDIVDWRVPEQREKLIRDLAGWAGLKSVPAPENGHHVFISYKNTDKPKADRIKAHVERLGYSCWMAPDSRRRNRTQDYSEEIDGIYRAIRECRCLLFVLSPQSLASPSVVHEVRYALSTCGKPVIPFLAAPIPAAQKENGLYRHFLRENLLLNEDGAGKGKMVLSLLDPVLKEMFPDAPKAEGRADGHVQKASGAPGKVKTRKGRRTGRQKRREK